jgi:ATP-dependent helicase/DNAse subunit B
MFHLDTELDLAAADALDEIATLFKRFGSHDAASVIDAIENVTLRQPATDNQQPVVHASDVLRFRGRSFQHLFVVRMQDDVFPQRRIEDPLLPDADRRALGIREIGDGADEEKLLFQLLLDSSEHVTFSFAASDGFGKVLRVSRFARHAVVGSRLSVVSEPITHRQPTTNNRQLQLLVRSGTQSTFDGYLTAVSDQIKARLHAISPTQLEDFGECPQKFLLKHILGVEDVDHPERELQIQPRDKGKLDHEILERFYKTGADLEALIDEAFDRHEQEQPPFNRTIRAIERRATKRLLREFVESDRAELEASHLTPQWFEYRFGTKHRELAQHPEPFVVNAAGVPIRIEGMIDRIDSDGVRFRIVDYKSGKALRHAGLSEKIDRGVRLQLALYAMAVAEFFGADAANVSGAIKPLVVEDAKPAKYAFALAEKRDGLLETLELFVSSILASTFPAFPIDGDFDSCKYCPVNHSCRTRHDFDERHAAQRQKDPRTMMGTLR